MVESWRPHRTMVETPPGVMRRDSIYEGARPVFAGSIYDEWSRFTLHMSRLSQAKPRLIRIAASQQTDELLSSWKFQVQARKVRLIGSQAKINGKNILSYFFLVRHFLPFAIHCCTKFFVVLKFLIMIYFALPWIICVRQDFCTKIFNIFRRRG